MTARALRPDPPPGDLMAKPRSPAHCYPARDGSVPELERAVPCLGLELARRNVQIDGLQAWARQVTAEQGAK